MASYFSNTGSSGRGQRGINFKDRARNGRAAEPGVIARIEVTNRAKFKV
jgi:hypothetical protein